MTTINLPSYTNKSRQAPSITERARKVTFRGDTPNHEYHGFIEVMSGRDGVMEVHVEKSMLRKYSARSKKPVWHTESVYATISAEDWRHLLSAPQE